MSVVRDRPILCLDEASAALDKATDQSALALNYVFVMSDSLPSYTRSFANCILEGHYACGVSLQPPWCSVQFLMSMFLLRAHRIR